MPRHVKSTCALLVIFCAFSCPSHAAQVYTESFAAGSNGWHWIKPVGNWEAVFTNGVARIGMRPVSQPNPTQFVVLSSTNNPVVSGGAFTGDYETASIQLIGFSFFAFNLVSDSLNTVDLQWGNSSNAYVKLFTPIQTGVWHRFRADISSYDRGGWTTLYGSETNFASTRRNVEFVQIKFFGADTILTGSRTNVYLIDDIYIDYLHGSSSSMTSASNTPQIVWNNLRTNEVYRVEASPDLVVPQWDVITTITAQTSTVATDYPTTNDYRFFRMVMP